MGRVNLRRRKNIRKSRK